MTNSRTRRLSHGDEIPLLNDVEMAALDALDETGGAGRALEREGGRRLQGLRYSVTSGPSRGG